MNLDWCRWLAELDLRIFPVHGVVAGICTCSKGIQCNATGKHPIFQGWQEAATTDMDVIARWVAQYPSANVGIACGDGLGVFDVDPRNGGHESLERWEETARPECLLPATLTFNTGGGGTHRLYRVPPGTRSTQWLPGVDFQCEGKLIVAPGSTHRSGVQYTVREPVLPLADLPPEFIAEELSRASTRARGKTAAVDPVALLDGVPEGGRNQALFDGAWTLRHRDGVSQEGALAVILAAARSCDPPYPDADAREVVARVYSYVDRPGTASVTFLNPDAVAWAQGLTNKNEDDTSPSLLFPTTDMGNAARLVRHAGERLAYTDAWKWLVFDGTRWAKDALGQAQELAKETIVRMGVEEGHDMSRAEAKEFQSWVKASQSAPRVSALLKLAASDPGLVRRAEDFDQDDAAVNSGAGVLWLPRTGEYLLQPHEPARLITKILHVAYEVGADCPRFLKFLERIMPDPDDRWLLQRAAGYSLTGDTSAKAMVILWGAGDNGKSVLLATLRWVWGDYATSAHKSVLIAGGTSHRFALAPLAGTRLVVCSEIAPGDRLNTDMVKAITSGDEMTVENKGERPFELRPTFKLWLATNHKPGTRDVGPALARRIRLIPFTEVIPHGEQRDMGELLAEFREEGAGILNWALTGLRAVQEDGMKLLHSAHSFLETSSWLADEDTLGQFIEHALEPRADWWTSSSSVLRTYRAWCAEEGMEKMELTGQRLATELKERGFVRHSDGQLRGWRLVVRQEARSPLIMPPIDEHSLGI